MLMGIKLGVGGKIGPFRAGISTRGVGGGVGPVSAGTGWGKKRGGSSGGGGCAALIGLALVLAAAYYALGWPWLATRSIARTHHMSPDGQHVVAWMVEGFYLLLVLLALAAAAAKNAVPVLVGLGAFGIAFIVAALVHGHYDVAAVAAAHRQQVAAAQAAKKAEHAQQRATAAQAAAAKAKQQCTRDPYLVATVTRARDLMNQLAAQYPADVTNAQENEASDLYDALDKSDDTSVGRLSDDIEAWTYGSFGDNIVTGFKPPKKGIIPAMQRLLADCSLTK